MAPGLDTYGGWNTCAEAGQTRLCLWPPPPSPPSPPHGPL